MSKLDNEPKDVSRRNVVIGATGLAMAGAFMDQAEAKRTAGGRNLAEAWAHYWTEHDVPGLLSLFTEDAAYEDLALGHISKGRAELKKFFDSTLVTFPDFKVAILNSTASADAAAGEWEMSGTFLGESFGQKPTGKSFKVRGCCFMRLKGGLISYHTDYWNPVTFEKQVAP